MKPTFENVLDALLVGFLAELGLLFLLPQFASPGFVHWVYAAFHWPDRLFHWFYEDVFHYPHNSADNLNFVSYFASGWLMCSVTSWGVITICRRLSGKRERDTHS